MANLAELFCATAAGARDVCVFKLFEIFTLLLMLAQLLLLLLLLCVKLAALFAGMVTEDKGGGCVAVINCC